MVDARHAGGLTAAFYGPAVPPTRTSRSVGRGLGSCCCGCLFCGLLQILLTIVVVLGIVVLALWLIFRPNQLKVHVENAVLARFDVVNTPNSSLDSLAYNLTLDVSIRNPNRRVAFYYDTVEAVAVYDGHRFGYDNGLPVFFQDHKNTTLIHPSFYGQQVLAVASTADTYRKEARDGWFYVEVKIYTRVRFKVWFIKTNKYTPKFTCDLKLPAPGAGSGTGGRTFSPTRCNVDLF